MARIRNAALLLLSFASSLVTIAFAWLDLGKKTSAEGKIAILVLAAFVVALFIYAARQEFAYSRKARYAESLRYLGHAFARLQSLACDQESNISQIQSGCEAACNDLSAALTLISATHCSVCIKALKNADPAGADPHLEVATLCRDTNSGTRETSTGRHVHFADQNTDFNHIHERLGTPTGHFLSNYLPYVPGYQNSSFAAYGRPTQINFPIIGALVRDATWTLPYKSTVVVPISTERTDSKYGKLVGYLCVDSRSRGAFKRRYDVEVLFAVAGCLYDVLGQYWHLQWGNDRNENELDKPGGLR
jgi:hypothetical protein